MLCFSMILGISSHVGVPTGYMASLSSDIFYDILRRLDGLSLASAACTCASLSSISREEKLWEEICASIWPSTSQHEVKSLISSIGGFRKFYADCFPLIVNKEVFEHQWCTDRHLVYPEDWSEAEYYGEAADCSEIVSPSDVVSIIDIRYKDKMICSKAVWGIPNANRSNGWFYNCPFRIDLPKDGDEGGITISVSDGLHPVESLEQERKDGKLWRDLREGIRLSWIVVNKKVKRAANLSSWTALGGQRHWPTDKDFVMRFGSVLPAKHILPCQVVECVLVMKFRVTQIDQDGFMTTLRLMELGMTLEDMMGAHVNGRNSLFILEEALGCCRSRNHGEVVESCQLYSEVQNQMKEEKLRNESMLDRLCIVSGITAFLAFWYYVL